MKINQYNEKGNRHGYWEIYWPNGTVCFKGSYNNGIKIGYCEIYWENGELRQQIFYY
jgi:antitoxin component YwqK of YwqJK toxin-antitoxin module